MITRKSSIHELELAGSNARFHVDLLTKAKQFLSYCKRE